MTRVAAEEARVEGLPLSLVQQVLLNVLKHNFRITFTLDSFMKTMIVWNTFRSVLRHCCFTRTRKDRG